MNLHRIQQIDTTRLIYEYCQARFRGSWDWRIFENRIQYTAFNRNAWQEIEYEDFKTQAIHWERNGRPNPHG